MKRLVLFFACSASSVFAGQKYLLDKIEAVVLGSEVTDLVTKSDLERNGFDGKPKSKDDIILERLMFQDALRYRVMIDDKAIDDYIGKLRKQHNATLDDIKEMFRAAGYSYEEGRRQLGMVQATNQVIDYKLKSKVLVTEAQVKEYYDQHPEYKPAVYRFERSFIKESEGDLETIEKKLKMYEQTGRGLTASWRSLPDVVETELDDALKFLTKLKVDKISSPRKISGGYDIFRLRWKKEEELVSLEERYRAIAEELRRPKFDILQEEYKKELLKDPPVIYLK